MSSQPMIVPPRNYHVPSAIEEMAQGSLDFALIANRETIENRRKKESVFNTFCQETNLNGWYYISKKDLTTKEQFINIVGHMNSSPDRA